MLLTPTMKVGIIGTRRIEIHLAEMAATRNSRMANLGKIGKYVSPLQLASSLVISLIFLEGFSLYEHVYLLVCYNSIC